MPHSKPLAASLGWRRLATRYLFESPWHRLRQDEISLPGGEIIHYTYQEHDGFVAVVPVTADGQMVLIRSYRYTVDAWVWEVPAGGLGGKPPLEAAQHEMMEEVGGEASHWDYLGWCYVAKGTTDMVEHIFLAQGVRLAHPVQHENTEVIEVHCVPARRALQMARDGEMRDGDSALAVLRAEPRLRGLLTEGTR